MATIRQIKLRLWNKNPHCHYCGVKTVLSESGVNECSRDPRTATVEHLFSRYNLKRWVQPQNMKEPRYVLSCQCCNNQQQIKEFNDLPKIEQLARNWGFVPKLQKLYPSLWDAYLAMRKVYAKYGVPTESIDRQVGIST